MTILMKIRPFTKSDEKEVIKLWFKCNLVVPWNNPKSDIERKLKVNPELFLVGIIDDRIISTVMGGYEGHRGWVNYLAVDPDFQKQKYGKEMMRVIEDKLKQLGCPKINLQVRDDNTDVIEFYKSIGYYDEKVVSLGKRLIPDEEYDIQKDY
jgi:ribosomal protein S18 acetylase RimI-like enzyme